jgi:hypothetical protein
MNLDAAGFTTSKQRIFVNFSEVQPIALGLISSKNQQLNLSYFCDICNYRGTSNLTAYRDRIADI